jgi:enoyl-CoA hydratase
MSEAKDLLAEQREHVGVITFNRPERRNALSPDLLLDLHETLERWASAGEVRAVVITGAGEKTFSSGYDIAAIPTDVSPETAARLRESNPLELGLSSVKHYPYPTIAMVNGHCFGAALNLALCCDLRIGADDVAIGLPAAKLGIVYPHQGIAQIASVLGMARTRQLLFTGRTYRGHEASEMGLVDRLVPRGDLEATTFATAEEIAANAPLALLGMKRALNLIEASAPLSDYARKEVEAMVATALGSEDAKEAQQAFLEKRAPRFAGR